MVIKVYINFSFIALMDDIKPTACINSNIWNNKGGPTYIIKIWKIIIITTKLMHEILADIIIRNRAVHEQHFYGAT